MKFFNTVSEKVEEVLTPLYSIGEVVYAPSANPTTHEVTYRKVTIISWSTARGYIDYLISDDKGKVTTCPQYSMFPVEEPKPKRGRPKKEE